MTFSLYGNSCESAFVSLWGPESNDSDNEWCNNQKTDSGLSESLLAHMQSEQLCVDEAGNTHMYGLCSVKLSVDRC